MKKIQFSKYQGTGNDFILIDNRENIFDGNNQKLIESLCHRRFGIGADGLMLLEKSEKASFTMRYYNSDGRESTMCGNGGRCIAAFAVDLSVANACECFSFDAVDGIHEAIVKESVVSLRMTDVKGVKTLEDGLFLDTGSPHFIKFVDDPAKVNVFEEGKFWRNHDLFAPGGANVNFVGPLKDGKVVMRTFERGVEDETWSCGTGAVASAIATFVKHGEEKKYVMQVPGGELAVSFDPAGGEAFENIWLKGPAKFVFEGTI